ncbi:MAG: quinol:electron acceptor oxidoreductase subunit ActD, partial [Chthoniobacterales bacterium]
MAPLAVAAAPAEGRDAGYTRWDVYSPFPIHGMDHAMGVKKSWLSALFFCGGL